MAELPPFLYDSVLGREIRLLTLDTSPSKPGLSWSLRKAYVDEPGLKFIALSYAWRLQPQSETHPICCNGRQLQVHHNLFTALPFLARRAEADTTTITAYWIDAICINQADSEEKVSQIRLMNTIYRRADKVLIWLGLALEPEWQDLMPRAIQLLPLLIRECLRSRQLKIELIRDLVVDRELSHLGRAGWEAILHLLRNDYFRRLWMTQELALAKEILFLCGDHEIDPQLIEAVASNCWNVRNWAIYDLTTSQRLEFTTDGYIDDVLFSIRNIINYQGKERNAHQTIRIANLLANQTCYAPQDRVLGILGMVEQEFGEACGDLYTYKSIADLYTRFSTLLFEASGLTKVHWWFYLSMAFNKNRMDGLPSWVPDLHSNGSDAKRRPYESMLAAQSFSNPTWQASSRPRRAAHGPRTGEIVLRGKLLDVVTLVHPEVPPFCGTITNELEWLSVLADLIDWEKQLADAALYNTSDELRIPEETYWRTLVAGSCGDTLLGTPVKRELWQQFREAGQRVLSVVQRHRDTQSNTAPQEHPSTMSDEEREVASCFRDAKHPLAVFATVLSFTMDHQLFNTKQRRLGFTCTGVQPGDVVCVFNDSVSPFVLRRVDDVDGTARFKFVGDAYVHGLMHEEADSIDVAEEDIVLV